MLLVKVYLRAMKEQEESLLAQNIASQPLRQSG